MRLTQIATHIAGIAIERQRAQETLREREARINLAAESADLAFWVIYPAQNTAWMSDKGRAIYGFDAQQALNRDVICGRVHPDERAAVHAAFDHACASFGLFESEHRSFSLRQDPWGIVRGRCLQDEHGNLLELIGVTIDISAQKQSIFMLQLTARRDVAFERVADGGNPRRRSRMN